MTPDLATASGWLRGRPMPTGGTSYLGVPYGAPPVGALRFRPPQPAEAWSGTFDASRPGPAAPQPVRRISGRFESRGSGFDEDCLRLDVHVPPGPAAHRPVLVWIHGGAFSSGSAALYDGSRLAALGDVVVVCINYRLGVLGFSDLPFASSNNGIRDQVLALEWVRNHVAAFGGDPGRVTVAGESAGSVAVSLLLVAAAARGLFRGAILQSGTYSLCLGPQVRASLARRYTDRLGPDFRAAPVADLLAAQQAIDAAMPGTVAAGPWFDDDVVPGSLQAAQAASRPDVAVLAGSNRDEVEVFRRMPGSILPTSRADVAARLTDVLPADHAAAVLAAYPADRRGDLALASDFDFGQPTRHLAERHAAAGGAAWVYRFDAGTPWLGATHAAELPYLWDWTGPAAWLFRGVPTAARRSLAARLQWHWVRFVRDLDPGGDWPAYDADDRRVTLFGVGDDVVARDPESARRVAWAGSDVPPKG